MTCGCFHGVYNYHFAVKIIGDQVIVLCCGQQMQSCGSLQCFGRHKNGHITGLIYTGISFVLPLIPCSIGCNLLCLIVLIYSCGSCWIVIRHVSSHYEVGQWMELLVVIAKCVLLMHSITVELSSFMVRVSFYVFFYNLFSISFSSC